MAGSPSPQNVGDDVTSFFFAVDPFFFDTLLSPKGTCFSIHLRPVLLPNPLDLSFSPRPMINVGRFLARFVLFPQSPFLTAVIPSPPTPKFRVLPLPSGDAPFFWVPVDFPPYEQPSTCTPPPDSPPVYSAQSPLGPESDFFFSPHPFFFFSFTFTCLNCDRYPFCHKEARIFSVVWCPPTSPIRS